MTSTELHSSSHHSTPVSAEMPPVEKMEKEEEQKEEVRAEDVTDPKCSEDAAEGAPDQSVESEAV